MFPVRCEHVPTFSAQRGLRTGACVQRERAARYRAFGITVRYDHSANHKNRRAGNREIVESQDPFADIAPGKGDLRSNMAQLGLRCFVRKFLNMPNAKGVLRPDYKKTCGKYVGRVGASDFAAHNEEIIANIEC